MGTRSAPPSRPGARRRGPEVARLLLLAALTAALSVGLDRLGAPSPSLFAGLVAGLAFALAGRHELQVPAATVTGSQAVLGVTMGVLVQPSTLTTLAGYWLPITGITLATLLLTVVAGLLLARLTPLDRTTAAFGMIAGGASGIVAISDELGADGRLVAVLQYLRVLLIAVLMPVAAVVLFGSSGQQAVPPQGEHVAWPIGVAGVLGIAVIGVWAGRLVHLPVPSLLGPLVIATVLAASGLPLAASIPGLLPGVAFAVIGAQVGLRFTRATLRTIRRILPVATALIVGLILASGGLGVALSAVAGLSPLDGYLATTPGGIVVVLAVAAGSGADSTVVLTVQVLRMLVMLLAGPPLARLLRER